mmetsp:Transcript_24157/g.53752  ORF Transcript_24157/g.53752 Transcript_24157/m.53752 type:complete len:272 (-) Transcript_24157:297-1112(-)
MGITNLAATLKRLSGPEKALGALNLKGRSVGVDFSVVLYKALRSKHAVDQFWADPKVPVTNISDYLETFVGALRSAGVQNVVFILDNLTPPAKELVSGVRRRERELSVEALEGPEGLFLRGTEEDTMLVDNHKRKAVYPRYDVIAWAVGRVRAMGCLVLGAPFEADGQLVAEQLAGRLDAIVTEDSDLFVLGGTWLLLNLHSSAEGWKCSSVRREEVLPLLEVEVLQQDLVNEGLTFRSQPTPRGTNVTAAEIYVFWAAENLAKLKICSLG